MRRLLRLLGAVVALCLVAASCSRGGASEAAPGEGVLGRTVAGTVTMRVSGAIRTTWSGATPIQVTTLVGSGVEPGAWLLSVGLLDPVASSGGWKVRPAFDLLGYHGDGSYTIAPPAAAGDLPGEATPGQVLDSDSFLVIGGHGHQPTMHGELLEPCRLTTEDQGLRGNVACPAVRGPLGRVAFDWSWEGTEVLKAAGPGAVAPADEATAAESPPAGPTGAGEGASATATSAPAGGGSGRSSRPLPLTVAMSSRCFPPGTPLTITFTTAPKATLAMALAYSDARTYGAQRLATADDTGRFVWVLTADAGAPPGEGHLLVNANSADGKRGAQKIETFEVKVVGC